MKWSWRIMQLSGISINVHVTFLLLPVWIAWVQYLERHRWSDAWAGAGFTLILFGIVVLHELAHAVTARRFGILTRDITLLPIGGVARLERMPEQPKHELLVALAGPGVNFCLAVFFFALLEAEFRAERMTGVSLGLTEFFGTFMWVNVVLACFNLLPAFPMDGGRVLRALLAMRLSYVQATGIAARIGQLMALGLALLGIASLLLRGAGLASNPFLVLIGVFVWVGEAQESGLVRMKAALGGVPVSELMIRDFRTLSPNDPLLQAREHLSAGWQQDFPVTDQGRLVGLLRRVTLLEGLARQDKKSALGDLMCRQFPTIDPAESAESALLRLRAREGNSLLAARDGAIEGIVTREKIEEFLMVRAPQAERRSNKDTPAALSATGPAPSA